MDIKCILLAKKLDIASLVLFLVLFFTFFNSLFQVEGEIVYTDAYFVVEHQPDDCGEVYLSYMIHTLSIQAMDKSHSPTSTSNGITSLKLPNGKDINGNQLAIVCLISSGMDEHFFFHSPLVLLLFSSLGTQVLQRCEDPFVVLLEVKYFTHLSFYISNSVQ